MKNKAGFAKELIITFIVASILSGIIVFILSFIFANITTSSDPIGYITGAGGTIWGLIFGYKINTLLRKYR